MTFVRLISNGATTSDMVQYAAKNWGLARRQSDAYVAEARAVIVDDINRERSEITAEMIHICQTVIKNSMRTNQMSNVIGAVLL